MAIGSIDAGHGGLDPGAVSSGIREADITLSVSDKLSDMLRADGHEIVETRVGDVSVGLDERIAIWTPRDLDFIVSVHCNSHDSDARGYEIWFQDGDDSSHELAKWINQEIAASFGGDMPNRGLKAGSPSSWTNWYTFQGHQPADVLVELGFLSNSLDRDLLASHLHGAWAMAVADGVRGYLAAQDSPFDPGITDYAKMINRQSVNERLIQIVQSVHSELLPPMKAEFDALHQQYADVIAGNRDLFDLDDARESHETG